MKYLVPKTIKEATAALGDLDDLITAKEWSRAAIVWAFTETAPGRRTDLARKGARLSVAEFAKLGIHGLTKRDTVAAYRQAWEQAIIDYGVDDAQPGQKVELPDVDWPGRQDPNGQRRYVEQDPGSFARAMQRGKVDPEAFAQDIDADTAAAIIGRIAEDRPGLVADAVAQAPSAQRAIARNTDAFNDIVDANLEVRPDQPMAKEDREASERGVRQFTHDVAGTLDLDEVVEYLRAAASDIAHAIYVRDEFGLSDPQGAADMLARIHRYLRVYEGEKEWPKGDDEWLASIGITVGEAT